MLQAAVHVWPNIHEQDAVPLFVHKEGKTVNTGGHARQLEGSYATCTSCNLYIRSNLCAAMASCCA